MGISLNKFVGAGQVRRSPRYRKLEGDKAVTEVSLEITGNGNSKTFVDITAWNELAEKCRELRPGDSVIVTGRLASESWEKEGVKHFKLKVIANSIDLARGLETKATPPKKNKPAATKEAAA